MMRLSGALRTRCLDRTQKLSSSNSVNSQRLPHVQSQSLHPQLTPQPHAEPQVHVPVQEQVDVQAQPVVFVAVVLASVVVVFMTCLVLGLPRSYPDCTSES